MRTLNYGVLIAKVIGTDNEGQLNAKQEMFIPARPRAAGYTVGIYYENSEENQVKPCEQKFVVLAPSTDNFVDEGNQCGISPFNLLISLDYYSAANQNRCFKSNSAKPEIPWSWLVFYCAKVRNTDVSLDSDSVDISNLLFNRL
jgi:hypothetical protein